MIVVDTNVIAYLCIGGDQATLAEDVLLLDNEWHAPVLWRSEFRNVIAGSLRRGAVDVERASRILAEAETLLFDREHIVGYQAVLPLVNASPCSAYDCEFVALAMTLQVPLITNDRQVLAAFPETAQSVHGFLGGV